MIPFEPLAFSSSSSLQSAHRPAPLAVQSALMYCMKRISSSSDHSFCWVSYPVHCCWMTETMGHN